MIRKIKSIYDKLFDKFYVMSENFNEINYDYLLWILLRDKIPGVKRIYGYKNESKIGWKIFLRLSPEPEYGQESTYVMMKNVRQIVMAKSLDGKDILDAIVKAARWDDVICYIPGRFRFMFNGESEFEILKKNTTLEELKIKYELDGKL